MRVFRAVGPAKPGDPHPVIVGFAATFYEYPAYVIFDHLGAHEA
jgi:hypothetical protein